MDEPTPWIFYVSRMGRTVVRDEIRKINLSQREQHSIEETLRRIASGEPTRGDIDYLGRNVWEVRVRLESRVLRLLYFIEMDPTLYMETTQSAVSEIETLGSKPRIDTIQRYARAVGYKIVFELVKVEDEATLESGEAR